MIRLAVPSDMTARERYGLDVLVDLSRVLVVLDPAAPVVPLTIVAGSPRTLGQALTTDDPFEASADAVHIDRAYLGHVTDLAGAAVEQSVTAADRHGRVPSDANPFVQAGRERDPVVQRWAMALRAAVLTVAGRRPIRTLAPWPERRRWAAAITHDLDIVAAWPAFTLLRAAELVRRGRVRRLGQVIAAGLGAVGRDPVGQGVRAILDVERGLGVSSTWFVLSGTPTVPTWLRGDITYRLESGRATRLIEEIMRAGNEIGLHGSLGTGSDAARFTEERNRLARRVDRRPSGVRQHFLRLRPGRTHLAMQQAGFQYDATCGFADRNGFRLGVADVVKAWLGNSNSELDTVPLTWMDRAASKYQGVEDPALLISEGVELARTCRDVEGLWVGLWHPNLVPALGFPGAPAAFRDLMHQVAGDGPYFSTLERLVSWRRARRAIRARQIAPDGRMDLISTHQSDWVIPIEDGQGRVLEPHPSMVLDA